MLRRPIWFSAGVVTGASAAVYGFVRLREMRGRLAPDQVAESLVHAARAVGTSARQARLTVREAVAEGRSVMSEAQEQIASDLDRRSPPSPRPRDP